MDVVATCTVVAWPVVVVGMVADASTMHFAAVCRNAARARSTGAVPVVRACIIVIIVRAWIVPVGAMFVQVFTIAVWA